MNKKLWIVYALITTVTWGVWGAFTEIPEKAGFPATLGYIVWAIVMVPCAVIALGIGKWKLEYDFKSILYGCIVGLFGAGGQLMLFLALKDGPAYIVFPFIGMYPVLTIILSVIFLKEKANIRQWIGIVLALVAAVLISYQKPGESATSGSMWLILSIAVFVLWALQNFVMKFANKSMSAESIFFYMTISGLLLIPFAYYMTDFSQEINMSFNGPYLAALIQLLNAIGALTLVYAVRYGKAIVVVPMLGISPRIITVTLSLILYSVIPGAVLTVGIVCAIIAILLMLEYN